MEYTSTIQLRLPVSELEKHTKMSAMPQVTIPTNHTKTAAAALYFRGRRFFFCVIRLRQVGTWIKLLLTTSRTKQKGGRGRACQHEWLVAISFLCSLKRPSPGNGSCHANAFPMYYLRMQIHSPCIPQYLTLGPCKRVLTWDRADYFFVRPRELLG